MADSLFNIIYIMSSLDIYYLIQIHTKMGNLYYIGEVAIL